jgi:hypothetical protein
MFSYRKDIEVLLNYFESISDLTAEYRKTLRRDAEAWLGTTRPSDGRYFDYSGFWRGACAGPFDRLSQMMARAKASEQQFFPLYETATEEQIRTAKCAFTSLPKKDVDTLLAASRNYLKRKDLIRLSEAYQMDSIPQTIARCMRVHAKLTTEKNKDKRDFIHFYDMTESALRSIVFIELGRNASPDFSEKNLYDNIYNNFINKNKDYYR